MRKDQLREFNYTLSQFKKELGDEINIDDLTEILNKLWNCEMKLKRLAEDDCNRGLTDKEIKERFKIEEEVKEMINQLGFSGYINNDPRGLAIRIILPSGESNMFDGETWGLTFVE